MPTWAVNLHLLSPMVANRIPRWLLRAALCGAVAMAAADVVLMMWRHPISARPPAIAEQIGLHADPEGDGLRVQWDRSSRPIRNADHAALFIEDGTQKNRLDLDGRQLDGSSVMYWPESEEVSFRLEVFCGGRRSDSTVTGVAPARRRRRKEGSARAVVQQLRPSPFEREVLEVVQTNMRPAPPELAQETAAVAETPAEPAAESRFERMISRIPLLRRLRKHPPSPESQTR